MATFVHPDPFFVDSQKISSEKKAMMLFPQHDLYTPENFIRFLQRKMYEKLESSVWIVRYTGFAHEEIIIGNRYERCFRYAKNLLYDHGYDLFEYLLEEDFNIDEEAFYEYAVKKFEKDSIIIPFDIKLD